MRKIECGINWNWYLTDTQDDAIEWYKELTGQTPKYSDTIQYFRNAWSFRLHK